MSDETVSDTYTHHDSIQLKTELDKITFIGFPYERFSIWQRDLGHNLCEFLLQKPANSLDDARKATGGHKQIFGGGGADRAIMNF